MKLDRKLPATMTLSSGIATTSGGSSGQNIPAKVAEVSTELLRSFPHSKRVGNYLLGRTLGEGSFAKVKEGLHTLTGEKVAIKVIDKKKARKDPYVRRNLRREGKLLQMVRHKNIVQLFEVMETENSYYLVTELCKGGDLMDRICNRRRLEEKETRRYIRQIISAIDHLHKAGVIHRDLKVENLLLDERKDIKIIDFGLSNVVRMNEVAEVGSTARAYCVTQCGSPAYAAPELLGNNKYGPQVDIWSIGVNMYAMLTGNLPFTVEPFNIKTLHSKMLKGDVNPLPDHLSNPCKDLLKRFLTADPEKRITLKEAMRHSWIVEGYHSIHGPGRNSQLEPAPFPNRLNADALQHDIVKFMADDLGFNLGDVIRMVSSNTASSATATYHLLLQKLTRYNAERRSAGKPSVTDARWLAGNRNDKVILTQTEAVGVTPAAPQRRPVNASMQKTTKAPPVTTEQPRILELKQSPRKFAQKAASPRQGTRATEVTGWTPGQGDSGDNESLATQRGVKADARGRHEDVLILRLAASHIDGNASDKPPHTTGAQPVRYERPHEPSRVTSNDVRTSHVTAIDVVKAAQVPPPDGDNRNGHVELPSLVRNLPDFTRDSDDSCSVGSDQAARPGDVNGRVTEQHNGRLSPTPEDPSGHSEPMDGVKPKAAVGAMHFAIVPNGPCVVTGRSEQAGTPTADPTGGETPGRSQPQSRGWRGGKHNAEPRISVKRPPMRRKLTLDMGNYDRYARSNSTGRTLPNVQGSGGDSKYPNTRRLLDFVYPLGSRDGATKNKLLANRQTAGRTSKASSEGGKLVGQERRAGNSRVTGLARHSIDSTPVSHHVVAVTEVTQVAPLDGRASPGSAGRTVLTPLSYTSKESKVTLPTISHFTIGAKAHPEVEQE